MVKEIDIIGVQMDLGASKRGVAMGPMAIRYGGLREGLEKLGHLVHDRGDIAPLETGESKPDLRYYEQVVDVNRRLYGQVTASLERAASVSSGSTPMVTGTILPAVPPAICTVCLFPPCAVMARIAW